MSVPFHTSTGVILRDFSLEEPALSEVEGILRELSPSPKLLHIRWTPDASQAQRHHSALWEHFKPSLRPD